MRKTFPLEREQRTLLRTIAQGLHGRFSNSNVLLALEDINLEIRRGERIAVVGNNGSGKTTLLKVIAGLHRPSSGEVHLDGQVSILAGFGIGMIDELTTEENVFLYGSIYGMMTADIHARFDEIIEWAELSEFTQAQLRTLSTGMRARLAFSVTRYIDADILLLDEALSAGDKNFNQKCKDYFRDSIAAKKTLVVATHDLAFVESFCSRTLWLHRGRQMAFDDTARVLAHYRQSG